MGEIPNGLMGKELKLCGYWRWFCVWRKMGKDWRCGIPCMVGTPVTFMSGLNCSGVVEVLVTLISGLNCSVVVVVTFGV